MPSYAIEWAWAFAFTQVIEVPIYRRVLGCSLVRAAGASVLTHPLIWLLFPRAPGHYVVAAVVAELFAWLAEAIYFTRPYGIRRALLASALANAASCVLGMISHALFGLP